MDFMELVRQRRSVRRFEPREVSRDTIARILGAALRAPSSKNVRSTTFVTVTAPEVLERISRMRDFGSAFLAGAPAAVVVTGDRSATDLWVDNCAISATYVQLAAEDLGLASCWVHVNGRLRMKDDPGAGYADEYLRTFLPVPDGFGILCAVALGYPAEGERRPHREPAAADKVIWME